MQSILVRRCAHLGLLGKQIGILVGLLVAIGPALCATRTVPPSEQEQATKLIEIKRLFKNQYAKALESDRIELARQFIAQAEKTTDDPTGRYVLLTQAIELASGAGAASVAWGAVDQIEQTTISDDFTQRWNVLARAQNTTEHDEQIFIVQHGIDLLHTALRSDNYTAGDKIVAVVQNVIQKSQDVQMAGQWEKIAKEYHALASMYTQVNQARTVLEKNPNDPAANLVIGKYYGPGKDQWDYALHYLTLATNSPWQTLAQKELNPNLITNGPALVQLADDWWEVANQENDFMALNIKRHAQEKYRTAAQLLNGLTLQRINDKLTPLASNWKPAATTTAPADTSKVAKSASGNPVDVLALVQLERDVPEKGGKWKKLTTGILSDKSAQARVEIPYWPAEEYDLRLEFCREVGDGPVVILLVGMNRSFGLSLDAKGHVARFEAINHKLKKDNPTAVPCTLGNGKVYRLLIQVRKDRVTSTLDDKPLCSYQGDAEALSRASGWKLSHGQSIGLGSQHSVVRFSKVDILEYPPTK